jgi:DNA-binding protein HU-beta
MNKTELVVAIAEKADVSKMCAYECLKATLCTISEAVAKGERVSLIGFGTFEPRKRAARTGINPQTGKAIKIAEATVPAFKAGKAFKEAVNVKPKGKKKK